MSFARISLLGNLGNDPESRYTTQGTLNVQFSMAVNPTRRRTDTEEHKPVWYRVSCWGEQADRIDKMVQAGHIAKGRTLYVEGKLEPRQFQGKDGEMRWSFDVTLTAWDFVGGDKQQQNDSRQGTTEDRGTYIGNPEIDDIPF